MRNAQKRQKRVMITLLIIHCENSSPVIEAYGHEVSLKGARGVGP